jgi:replicative DNA helicase
VLDETRGFPTIEDQAAAVREFSRNPLPRVPSGIPSVDIMSLGPAPGEVFYFCGSSGSGKSLVATNSMWKNPDVGMMFFSIEMPSRLVLQRLYGHTYDYPVTQLIEDTEAGQLPPSFSKLAEEYERHVVIEDAPIGLTDMSKYLRMYEAWYGERPKAVWVDYLELLKGGDAGEHGGRVEDMARNIKHWAKTEQMAVFVLHQTNMKEKPWDPPQQGSDRYGGYTQSDVFVGIWQPSKNPDLTDYERKEKKGKVFMHIIKNRITGRESEGREIICKLTPSLRLVDLTEQETRRFYHK